jgi:hypothetical protein
MTTSAATPAAEQPITNDGPSRGQPTSVSLAGYLISLRGVLGQDQSVADLLLGE